MRNFLHNHLLTIFLIPLFVLFVGASFVRFVIANDYLVSYEVACDPSSNSCYIGCEDEECSEEYYYYVVEKDEISLERMCGVDITNCLASTMCMTGDKHCVVSYCEPNGETVCALYEELESSNTLNYDL